MIYYSDWECDGVGSVVHYTAVAGDHHLLFDFGGEQAEAFNAAGPDFETGEVTVSDSLVWTSITFDNTYTNPPVILATPVSIANCSGTCSGTGAGNGGMYPIPLVRNVTTSGFDISMCVDGGNTTCSTGMSTETFHWFAFDVDDAANFDWIEAGTKTVATNGSDTAHTYTTSFAATPHVWTQAQTYSQAGEIGAHAWVEDNGKTTSGFTFVGCVHTGTGNSCDSNNPSETFGYVAIDTTNEAFPANVNFQSGMANIKNSTWTAASFSPTYTNPRVMVTQNDDDGGQDPEYAWAKSVTSSGMDFRYCEEDAGNLCNSHTSEKTYWFVLEEITNTAPTISSVTDSPDPVEVDSNVTFSADWNDADAGDNIKVKICKTDSLTNQNCDGGFWATSSAFTTNDPEAPTYTAQEADAGTQNYYTFVCDDGGLCSSSTSGTFDVNATPTITGVTDSPDPVFFDANINFVVDWNDANVGENVKVKICKTGSLTNRVCDGGYWASSSVFTISDPESPTYTVQASDEGDNNYYAFVCDDQDACSASYSGVFTAQDPGTAPVINTSSTNAPATIAPRRSAGFMLDWNDSDGHPVKIKVCKTNSLTNQNCDGGFWASSSRYFLKSPIHVKYDIQPSDYGQTRNYAVFVCDRLGFCSSGSTGSFTVKNIDEISDIGFR